MKSKIRVEMEKLVALRGYWQFRSLGARIQSLVGIAFVAGVAIFLSLQSYSRINLTVTERRDANTRIVQGLSGPMSEVIKGKNDSVMYGYMEILETDPTAAAVVIASGQKILQSQQSINYRSLPLKKLKALVLKAENTGTIETMVVDEYQFVATPVRDSSGRIVGSFSAAWSIKGIFYDVLRSALLEALALISLVTAILWMLVHSLNKLIVRPLAALADQLDGSGKTTDISVYENRSDEIGSFARALGKFARLHGHLDAALANMTQGICMFDEGQRLLIFNDRFCDIYSIPPSVLQPGMTMLEVMQIKIDQNKFGVGGHENYASERFKQAASREPSTTTHRLGSGQTIVVSHQPTSDGGWVETHSDITDLRRIEEQVEFQAQHDSLTGLSNRTHLRDRLDKILDSPQSENAVSIFYIDLDGFKTVNDTLGHAIGDNLLKAVADRLRAFASGADIVGRLGGDEFVIAKCGLRSQSDVEHFGLEICADLAKPFVFENCQVLIGASIGTAIAPHDGKTPDQLLKNADLALYEAKKRGKNSCHSYSSELSARLLGKRELELELRTALREEQFELHYQPLVDLKSNEITGFEALLRWRHPIRGMVPPDKFISLAEEIGMIIPLGEWVLRKACLEAAKWPANTRIAVNVSPVQFHGCDLAQVVFSALAASQLAAYRLELEMTESILLQNNAATLETLHKLRNFGVRIAIDDFGTGYSALGYLRKFPFDKIKIDRSFIGDLTDENRESIIVNSIVAISRSLKISTVAEGVETELQRSLVDAAGVTEMQGYLFSRPLPAQDVTAKYFPQNVSAKTPLLKVG
jgi:diguanylate cyclase (GGDEF)-like protein